MKTKEIIIELLEHLEMYEKEAEQMGADLNMADFISFVNFKQEPKGPKVESLDGGNFDWKEIGGERNTALTDISILVTMMYRYAKMYIKKAFKDSQIRTVDEFSFLITLLTHESMTKQEAINIQVMEKTSGIEILNRLIKQGYIEQFQDAHDKRSARIKITQNGKFALFAIMPQMRVVSEIVVGNLNESERNLLAYLLRKLDHYHNDIFINRKDEELTSFIYKSETDEGEVQLI